LFCEAKLLSPLSSWERVRVRVLSVDRIRVAEASCTLTRLNLPLSLKIFNKLLLMMQLIYIQLRETYFAEESMAGHFQQLETFVKEALQSGKNKNDIANALGNAGWPDAQVKAALATFSDDPFPIPVPKPRPSLSSRDAFLYLVMFGTLYFGVWHLGNLFFIFIERAFPDAAKRTWYNMYEDQRWSSAAIIVSVPVFLYVANYIGKQIKLNPYKRLSPVRRWITYITLFICASVLVGDVTTLVYNLLGGDLTIRFILKVLVVATLAGTGFVYYLLDLRKGEKE